MVKILLTDVDTTLVHKRELLKAYLFGKNPDENKIIIEVTRLKQNDRRTISSYVVDRNKISGTIIERDGQPENLEVVSGSKKRIKAGIYNFEITAEAEAGKEYYIDKSLILLNVLGRWYFSTSGS